MGEGDTGTGGNSGGVLWGPRLAEVKTVVLVGLAAGLPPPRRHVRGGGNAGDGLPGRMQLTLAEVVSWLAWGHAFPREDYYLAGRLDFYRDTVARLEAADAAGEAGANEAGRGLLPAYREALAQAEAALADIERAAGGAAYGGDPFTRAIGAAGARLFEALRARRLTAWGKRRELDGGDWEPVPPRWLWTNPADPRPPVAYLDVDWIARTGDTPLDYIVGPHARDPQDAPDTWVLVCFEREDVLRAFGPGVAQTGRMEGPTAAAHGAALPVGAKDPSGGDQEQPPAIAAVSPTAAARVPYSRALFRAEYMARVARWQAANARSGPYKPPSPAQDAAWAAARFDHVPRPDQRIARREMAPAEWCKSGPRRGADWRE